MLIPNIRRTKELKMDRINLSDLKQDWSSGIDVVSLLYNSQSVDLDQSCSILLDTNILNQISERHILNEFLNPRGRVAKKFSIETSQELMLYLYRLRTMGKLSLFVTDLNLIELFSKSKKHFSLWEYLEDIVVRIVPTKEASQELWYLFSGILTFLHQENYITRSDFKDFYIYCLASLTNVRYVITNDKSFKDFYDGFVRFQTDLDENKDRLNHLFQILLSSRKSLDDSTEFSINVIKIIKLIFQNPSIPLSPLDLLDETESLIDISELDELASFWVDLLTKYSVITSEFGDYAHILNEDLLIHYIEELISVFFTELDLSRKQIDEMRDISFKQVLDIIQKDPQPISKDLFDLRESLGKYILRCYILIEKWDLNIYWDLETAIWNLDQEKAFLVQCEECQTQQKIICTYNGANSVDSREMGDELEHIWQTEVDCNNCGSSISMTYFEWEYPPGEINHSEEEIDGGILIENKSEEWASSEEE